MRDCPPSFNCLVMLALQMDKRLRERYLERAQASGSAARTPEVRPGGHYGLPFGPTPAAPLSPLRAPLSRLPESEEPMQLGRSRLSSETRDQRMCDRLCLYCGKAGHIIRACPVWPNTRLTRGRGPSEPVRHHSTLEGLQQPVPGHPCLGPGITLCRGPSRFGG